MSELKIVNIELVLTTINNLLDTPMGSQIYAKDIRNLLDIIELQKYPPIMMSGKFTAPNQPTKANKEQL